MSVSWTFHCSENCSHDSKIVHLALCTELLVNGKIGSLACVGSQISTDRWLLSKRSWMQPQRLQALTSACDPSKCQPIL